MKSKIIMMGIALACSSGFLHAQQVISSSGAHAAASGIQLSWTIGEPVVETLSAGNVILTQGFHQPKLSASAIDDKVIPGLTLAVYPNPFSYELNIRVDEGDISQLKYTLFTADGKAISSERLKESITSIDMKTFATGNYLIRVDRKNGTPVKTFKVIKQ